MKGFLRLIIYTGFFCLPFTGSAAPADTSKGKHYIALELNYGIPVYNRLTVDKFYGFSKEYKVDSKLKSCYDVKFAIALKKHHILLGLSLIRSEFRGEEYTLGAGPIPYKGLHSPYYYNMYQRINYDVYYLGVGYRYNFKIRQKHTLSPSFELLVPLVYEFKINNYYGTNQTSDTTKFSPTKNAWNKDSNYGRFPRFKAGLSYRYNPIDRLGILFNLSFIYATLFDQKIPDSIDYSSAFNHSGNYSFLAYSVTRQTALIPSVGINFKLN